MKFCSWPGRSATSRPGDEARLSGADAAPGGPEGAGNLNRSESKYFHTAARMDEALLALLETRDMEYITVKEICERAGVNRSTFYLHYETLNDLLTECIAYMNEQFLRCMGKEKTEIVPRLRECPEDELYFVTPEYLEPYLRYIRQYRRLFATAVKHAALFRMENTYDRMLRAVFTPVLERMCVPEADREYIMSFYIHGLMAIIARWVQTGCKDDIEHLTEVIQCCVVRRTDSKAFERIQAEQ